MIQEQIRIIDNKKVLMTNDEFLLYEEVCKGYDRPNFKGKDLFQDHFEANEDGIIVFVKPPNKKVSSMEVFTFLISIMVNQQLRIAQNQFQTMIREVKEKFTKDFEEIATLKEELNNIKSILLKNTNQENI
jgi:ribosomal protein S17E